MNKSSGIAQKLNNSNTCPEGQKKHTNERVHGWKINWFPSNGKTIDDIEERWKEKMDADYWIYQIEECPTTKKLHIEGYGNWKNKKYRNALRNQLPGAHIEPARNEYACELYSSKTRSRIRGPYEHGKKLQQGERTDWKKACLDFPKNPQGFIRSYPDTYVKYHKGLEALKERLMVERTTAPESIYVYNMDEALDNIKTDTWYVKDKTKWWSGYEQQETVIIRDKSVVDLEALESSYPITVETKGSATKFNSKYLIIIK